MTTEEIDQLVFELAEYASFMGSYEDEPERKRLMQGAVYAITELRADRLEAIERQRAGWNKWADDLAQAIYEHFYAKITYEDGEPVDHEVDPEEVKRVMMDYHTWKNHQPGGVFYKEPTECTIVHSDPPTAPDFLAVGTVNQWRERCG